MHQEDKCVYSLTVRRESSFLQVCNYRHATKQTSSSICTRNKPSMIYHIYIKYELFNRHAS